MRAGQSEACNAVIERGSIPTLRGMAVHTVGSGKGGTRSGVHRIVGLLPGSQVAAGITAIGGSDLEVVVVIDVAGSAEYVGVAVGEREPDGRMVELAIGPRSNGMASGASRGSGGETRGDVIGDASAKCLRFVPIGRMAGHALGRTQGVVVVDVAGGAGRRSGRHVRARQRKAGGAVIERGRGPSRSGVAIGTIGCRESRPGGRVNRIVRLLPSGEVATGIAAIGGSDRQVVVIVDVAGQARNVGVAVGQQKAGGAVIKGDIGPRRGVVAVGTVGSGKAWTGLGVRRIVGLLPSREMATGIAAIGGSDRQVVVIVDMARSARKVGVAVGQQKAGGAVIEFRSQPAIKVVAALTIRSRKDRRIGLVRRICGVLPIL